MILFVVNVLLKQNLKLLYVPPIINLLVVYHSDLLLTQTIHRQLTISPVSHFTSVTTSLHGTEAHRGWVGFNSPHCLGLFRNHTEMVSGSWFKVFYDLLAKYLIDPDELNETLRK